MRLSHDRQCIESHARKSLLARLGDDPLGQCAADCVSAKLRANVEPFHFADVPIQRVQRDAAGDFAVPMRDQDRIVVARKGRHFALEILEREVDAERIRIFEEELAHDGDINRSVNVEHSTRP